MRAIKDFIGQIHRTFTFSYILLDGFEKWVVGQFEGNVPSAAKAALVC